jgi:hypothetical protein
MDILMIVFPGSDISGLNRRFKKKQGKIYRYPESGGRPIEKSIKRQGFPEPKTIKSRLMFDSHKPFSYYPCN